MRQDCSFASKQESPPALLVVVRSSSQVRLGAGSCSRSGSVRHVVLLGLAQESEQRRAAGPWRADRGLRAGRRTRSGGARDFLEPRVRFAGGDLAEVEEEDRVCLVQLADCAVDGVVFECGPLQESPGSAEAGDPGVFGVTVVGDDHDAVGVRDGALSLLVGIAGEAAGALATLEHSAAVGADRGVGRDRSGEPTDRFVADVAWCGAGEQTDVAFRHAGGAQCLDRAARRELGGICLGERGHGDVLRREPCRRVGCADHALGRLRRICGAVTAVAADVRGGKL